MISLRFPVTKDETLPDCCFNDAYDSMFTSRGAPASARRFRKKGLTGAARHIAEAISAADLKDSSVLEIGSGVGQIQVALLEDRAVTKATNIELSKNWEIEARLLLAERGLEDRAERIIGDFMTRAEALPGADAVILHRVVCCYPDWRALLAAAVSKSNRLFAVTFPMDRWWVKAMVGLGNRFQRLRNEQFRSYVHPAEAMIVLLRQRGFEVSSDRRGFIWRTLIACRD